MIMTNEPKNIIEIPTMTNLALREKNYNHFLQNEAKFQDHCACCGKGIKEPKFWINTIYGGDMYPANDMNQYNDSWQMAVGNECVKKIPTEYIIKGA